MNKYLVLLFLLWLLNSCSHNEGVKYKYLNECERYYMNLGIDFVIAKNRCAYRELFREQKYKEYHGL